jgi:hypothetical protein
LIFEQLEQKDPTKYEERHCNKCNKTVYQGTYDPDLSLMFKINFNFFHVINNIVLIVLFYSVRRASVERIHANGSLRDVVPVERTRTTHASNGLDACSESSYSASFLTLSDMVNIITQKLAVFCVSQSSPT